MLTGKPPYYHLNDLSNEDFARYIKTGNLPNFPEALSEQCKEFLQCVFQVDPKKRPSIQQLLNLKFITEPDSIDLTLEQLSPYEKKSRYFQSSTSLGFLYQDIPQKQMLQQIQNGFYAEEPPYFMQELNNEKKQTNMQNRSEFQQQQQNKKQLNDFSQIQTNEFINRFQNQNNNNIKTDFKSEIQIFQSEQSVKYKELFNLSEDINQKEQLNIQNKKNKHIKTTNKNNKQTKDEYQQQLIIQLKELEYQKQEINTEQKKDSQLKEQKDVEDEILQLISKKKETRKQRLTIEQQNGYKSESTIDSSLPLPLQPLIRYQVVFNNPKNCFKLLQNEETIKYNELLLQKQYNDIEQQQNNQSDSSPQSNKSDQSPQNNQPIIQDCKSQTQKNSKQNDLQIIYSNNQFKNKLIESSFQTLIKIESQNILPELKQNELKQSFQEKQKQNQKIDLISNNYFKINKLNFQSVNSLERQDKELEIDEDF